MTDRLAAALHAITDCSYDDHRFGQPHCEWTAAETIAADPTIVCQDPADHELADAVRRLPEEMRLRWTTLQPKGQEWLVTKDGFVYGTGPTPEVAIAAALEQEKP